MKKTLTLLLFLYCGSLPIFAQQAPWSRAKIFLNDRNAFQLARLGIDITHGELATGRFFISDFSAAELQLIQAAGFRTEVLIEDVQAYYVSQNQSLTPRNPPGGCPPSQERYPYPTPAQFELGSMGGFYTYQEMLDILDTMAARYPQLISVRAPIEDAQTVEGRPIYWVRMTDNPNIVEPEEKEVLYTALHHAREPNGLSSLIFYMWYLLEHYDTDPEVQFLLNNTALYLVPCINPDGYLYNEFTNPNGGGMWRKNRQTNFDNTFGVDLNRNYGYEWGHDDVGSSPAPPSAVYRGTAPFSEPETQAIRDFCYDHDFITALNFHTYGNVLVYPWGYSDTVTEDAQTFSAFAELMTLQNNYRAGTGTETVGYTVNGNSDDWMYAEQDFKSKIFSMTPEVGSSGFWPIMSEIIPNCKSTMLMSLATAGVPHRYGLLNPTNSRALDSPTGEITFQLKRYGLEDGAFTVSLAPISSNIASVGAPETLQPAAFETVEEAISYTLQGTLQEGEEVLFLLTLDNGYYAKSDTIRYFYTISQPALADYGNTMNNWETLTPWGITSVDYFSFPTSISDSPQGNYNDNAITVLNLKEPLTLTDFDQARLLFRARWDIEANYDFAQVQISVNGASFFPVCGKYTVIGGQYQDLGEPVYEGGSPGWVAEEMDLTPYVQPGDEIIVQFRLESDGFANFDGFYFDDLELYLTDSLLTSVNVLPASQFQLGQSYPNPARDYTYVEIATTDSQFTNSKLIVVNALGQTVWQQAVSAAQKQTLRIETADWASGVYFYQLENAGRKTPARRFCVSSR